MSDPFEDLAHKARQRVLEAGMSGGALHEKVDPQTVALATWSWGLQSIRKEIRDSNARLLSQLAPQDTSKKALMARNAPGASVGLGVGAALTLLVTMLREWFGK